MSEYKIGDPVELNGKKFTIVGTVKRSWLLEKEGSHRQYKATSTMMNRIKEQNKNGIGTGQKREPVDHIKNRLKFLRIFDKSAKAPETEKECLAWLERISCDLSPENLHCDGEISRTAALQKGRKLRAEWIQVEKILGYVVSEHDLEMSL